MEEAMKFTIKKNSLYKILSSVGRAASLHSPLPILSGIKFELKHSVLTLIASNSNISIKETLVGDDVNKLECHEEGSVVLESRYVLEAVRKLEGDIITFEIIDGSMTRISGNQAEYTINGSKADLFPNIDFTKPEGEFKIPGFKLAEVISQTAFVCSNSENRPIFTGVNFKAQGTELTVVSTDSYRLAKKTITIDTPMDFNITIPASNLYEVVKSVSDNSDIIVCVSDKLIQFYVGATLIQSRLIDGLFPDVNRLIPTDFGFELTVNAHEMINAVDRSSFLKSDGYWTVKLEASQDGVIISSKAQEIGSSEETIVPLDYKGGSLRISFSGRYLIEGLKSFKSDTVKLSFVGEMAAFILQNDSDPSIVQMILPVRTFE